MASRNTHFQEPVSTYARKDFATLSKDLSVQHALDTIRENGVGEKIIYFYVVDENKRLVGVVPTRRLLTAPLSKFLSEIMVSRIVAIPHTVTVLEACEMFVMHKFLAFPVVNEQRQMVGTVDVNLLTEEILDISQQEQPDEIFEAIGFHVSQVRDASPLRAFRFRFPWLLTTILSGTMCALLARAYELTLAKSLVLTFFLTLVIGLGESVSIQSMTVTIQALRSSRPTFGWYLGTFRREIVTALLLGTSCGTLVGFIVWIWRGTGLAAIVIGASLLPAICMACLMGLSVPTLLHALKLDPKISAGPITLALTDIFTLLFYFSLAALFL
ncbi:MAG: magnesium transporter [Verrucomicrobiota bacterium]|nr:magnesium transporter [Verrucomicrobiota bacterium]